VIATRASVPAGRQDDSAEDPFLCYRKSRDDASSGAERPALAAPCGGSVYL